MPMRRSFAAPTLALLAACAALTQHAAASHLKISTYYGFNPEAGTPPQHQWTTHGVTTDMSALVDANTKYGIVGFYGDLPDPAIVDRHNKSLGKDWRASLDELMAELKPLFANGTLVGIFLGDEINCAGVPYADLDALASGVKASAAAHGIEPAPIVYTNECRVVEKWNATPAALDILSIDIYDYKNTSNEVPLAKATYEKYIFPILRPHQGAMVVPGTFWCTESSAASQDAGMAAKMGDYFAWLKQETRLIGLNPWHYNYRGHPQHGEPCNMQGGAVQLNKTMAVLNSIGSYIKAGLASAEP